MKRAWDRWVEGNGTTYKAVCLLNNERTVKNIEEKMVQRGTDKAEDIVGDILDDDYIELGGTEEVQAVIDHIKEKNPDVLNGLTPDQVNMLCNGRRMGQTDEQLLEFARAFFPNKEGFPLSGIQALQC